MGLSPLPLAAARLPPPPLAGPGLCSVGRRGSLAYGSPPRPPGLIRARRSASWLPRLFGRSGPFGASGPARPPARSGSLARRPPPGPVGAPRRVAASASGLPPPCAALWSLARAGAWPPRRSALGGPGVPACGPQLGPAVPRSGLVRPPCAPPCCGAPGALWWSGLLPCRPPPGRPRRGLPGAQGPFGWAAPPARCAGGSPRGSRFSRPSPSSSPGGGGPPGPAFQPGCQS